MVSRMNRTIKRLSAGKLLFVIVSIQDKHGEQILLSIRAVAVTGRFAPSGRFICVTSWVCAGLYCGSLRPFCCAVRAPLSAFFTHQSKQHTPDVHLTVSLDSIRRGEKTEPAYFHIMSAANETPIVKALRKKKTSIGAMSKP